MTVLVVAEKPSAARNMATALGGMEGVFDGVSYEIVALRGHLYEYVEPHEQVPAELSGSYKSWDLGNLPWDPAHVRWARQPSKQKGVSEILRTLGAKARTASEVVVATDVDPSGEGGLLFAEPMIELGITPAKLTRMYFTDEAEASIREAFITRREIPGGIEEFDEYRKALARSKFDWLTQQFTRVATISAGQRAVLRQGRLKSAMQLLVGDQLKAHNGYVKHPFFQNRFRDENGVLYTNPEEPQFVDVGSVPVTYAASAVVLDSRSDKRVAPPRLLDLAGLSSRLSGKGVKAEDVLSTYQRMYEDQVVSYPRTEDKTITPAQFDALLPLVDQIAAVVGVDAALLPVWEPRRTHVRDTGAHGANRPGVRVPESLAEITEKYGETGAMIYDELARSTLAMFAEDYVYESQHGHVQDAAAFVGRAAVPKTVGWKQVFIENPDDTDTDPDDNAAGDGAANTSGLGTTAAPFVFEGKNKKPEHPSMTWLMKQLEKRDVGTGATRTSTYAEVTKEESDTNKYPLMNDRRGKVTLTEFGEMSYRLLPGTRIGDLGVTEHIYKEMQAVSDGSRTVDEVIAVVASWVVEDIARMKTNAQVMRDDLGLTALQHKEQAEGVWAVKGNKVVQFSRVWSGYRFTDAECAALLAGEEISITAVSEKKVQARAADPTFTVRGRLAEKEFDGRKMIRFDPDFANTGAAGNSLPPDSWCGHVFTPGEKEILSAGGEVTANDFISQKRTRFAAAVHFGQDGDRWKIIPTFAPRPKTQGRARSTRKATK